MPFPHDAFEMLENLVCEIECGNITSGYTRKFCSSCDYAVKEYLNHQRYAVTTHEKEFYKKWGGFLDLNLGKAANIIQDLSESQKSNSAMGKQLSRRAERLEKNAEKLRTFMETGVNPAVLGASIG